MSASPDGGQPMLIYAHDPMCSWCWAFSPIWAQIQAKLPSSITVRRLLGGLAPDSDQPMPEEMQRYLQQTWHSIQQQVPGTRFNFEFWTSCRPRRSTYPACRAVIAARRQDPAVEEPMVRAIQEAYYLQARNPSDEDTLVELASSLGLDVARFARDLGAEEVGVEFRGEVALIRRLGVQGFPSLVLAREGEIQPLRVDYRDPHTVLEQLA